MAVNNFLGKLKETSAKTVSLATGTAVDVLNNVPVMPAQSAHLGNKIKIGELKSQMKALIEEKGKLYQYVGMEVYDLCKDGTLNIPQIDGYCLKLGNIEQQLKQLVLDKKELEATSTSSTPKVDRVCPHCGNTFASEGNFCSHCGKSILEQPMEVAPQEVFECVCGAEVLKDQVMCLECGRKVEL